MTTKATRCLHTQKGIYSLYGALYFAVQQRLVLTDGRLQYIGNPADATFDSRGRKLASTSFNTHCMLIQICQRISVSAYPTPANYKRRMQIDHMFHLEYKRMVKHVIYSVIREEKITIEDYFLHIPITHELAKFRPFISNLQPSIAFGI